MCRWPLSSASRTEPSDVRLSAEPSFARPQLPRSNRWSRLRPPTTDTTVQQHALMKTFIRHIGRKHRKIQYKIDYNMTNANTVYIHGTHKWKKQTIFFIYFKNLFKKQPLWLCCITLRNINRFEWKFETI